jgi:hypothetical protein
MPKGVIGDSMDRATDKMDRMMSKGRAVQKQATLLDQLKAAYPDTWRQVIAEGIPKPTKGW